MQGTEGVELCSHITAMKLFALNVAAVFIYVPEVLRSHRNQTEGPLLKTNPACIAAPSRLVKR